MLWKIFARKGSKVIGRWRNWYKESHNLYPSWNQGERNWQVNSMHGKDKKCIQDYCVKIWWWNTTRRPRRIYKENIKQDLKETERECVADTGFDVFRTGSSGFEHGNEASSPKKGFEEGFLSSCSDYHPLKDYVPLREWVTLFPQMWIRPKQFWIKTCEH
jgi:hypothetical protein